MADPYPFGDLLATKLEIPLVGSRIVTRHRLTDVLKAGIKRRLTTVIAPAGYGKTTLLVEWLSEFMMPDWRIVWLTIDSFDNDLCRIWSYIASSIKKIYPRLHFDPQKSFQNYLEKSSIGCLTPLLNAISLTPYQIVVILDDYQWIISESVHQEIRYLLDHQPKNLHLLISSRVTPPFPLSRMRAQRQLVEITAKDLSFTLNEAKNFVSYAMEEEIDQDLASSLVIATEGWIAGLQLITLSLQDQPDRKTFIANLPEENHQIFEFLTEEVLDHQPPELRDFLLKTSILSELSVPLCDAVLERNDSREMLFRIQKANLFISPLDKHRNWYIYHRLFADTLQKYLRNTQKEFVPILHRRACVWLQANGYPDKAVTHSLAIADLEQAAKIIDACALQSVVSFDLDKLTQWLSRFSDELISKRPQLGIYYALSNFLLERFDKVEPKLKTLEKFLEKSREKELKIEDEKLIRWEIAAIRACLNYWQTNSADNRTNFVSLMQNQPESDVYFYGLMLHGLAEVHASHNDLEFAINAYSKGCQFAIDYGLVREFCYSQSELAFVRKMQGQLENSYQDYNKLIDYAVQFGISDDVIAFAKTGQAEIALEQNRMDQADELTQWVIENYDQIKSSPQNWIRQEWLSIRLARYYLSRQDLQNAINYFDKAMTGFRVNRQVVHYISSRLIDLQVKIWSAKGELNSRDLKFEDQIDFLDTFGKSKQAKKTALARYYLALGETRKALGVLDELVKNLNEENLNERLLEALVLKSLAYQTSGDQVQSINSLDQALKIAIPAGYHRVFTDEGDLMKILLKNYQRHLQKEESNSIAPINNFVGKLLSEFEQMNILPSIPLTEIQSTKELVQPMPEAFSYRELEVLKFIAAGKSTKEIAVALMISVNTTKVHIKNIYRKTETHTRSAALHRVMELGVLK